MVDHASAGQSDSENQQEEKSETQKRLQGLPYFIVLVWSSLALLICINQVFSLRIGGFFPVGYNYYFLGLYLPICFLIYPAVKKDADRIPWYDWMIFLICFLSSVYLGFNGLNIIDLGWEYKAPLLPTIAGTMLILFSVEAIRRTGGKPLFFICLVFAFYPMYAGYMPAMFWGPTKSLLQTIWAHSLGVESIIGIPIRMAGHLLPGFIFFGVAMLATGGGRFFMAFANSLLGHTRGGPAKVSIVASGFFGSISGSVVSNVITTGAMTIPSMKRAGYPPNYAGAIEACASTGGCFMPPIMGAAAFLIATFLNIPYITVCKAALLPAILYYGALIFQVDNYAARTGLRGMDKSQIPSVWSTLKQGWFYLFAFAALIYALIYLRVEAWAPFYATGLLIACAMIKKETRFSWRSFCDFIIETGRLMAYIVAILAAVGLIVGSLSITGVGNSFARELVLAAHGNIVFLLIFGTITSFILGMGMTVTACYIFLAVVLVPALVEVGLHPLGSHLFVMYWGMISYITPPVALGAITAAGIAGSNPLSTGFRAMRLGSVIYILPYLFVLKPALIMSGPAMTVMIAAISAIIGIAMIASALEKWVYTIGPVSAVSSVFMGISGVLLLYPDWHTDLIGLGVAVSTYLPLKLKKKNALSNALAE
jgi:TRAP transporter 4TM/12TM fusion protein